MEKETVYYKRHLPHYHVMGAVYFVTFRLAGSLPKHVVDELKQENELMEREIILGKHSATKNKQLLNQRKRYFKKFDKILDGSTSGSLWLRNETVADIVAEAIRYRHKKDYELYAYCIMPNHVHMLFKVTRNTVSPIRSGQASSPNGVRTYTVTKILQELKIYTALKANKLLRRTG